MGKKSGLMTGLQRLEPRQLLKAAVGTLADGGGLFLVVAAGRSNWVLRYTTPTGKRRDGARRGPPGQPAAGRREPAGSPEAGEGGARAAGPERRPHRAPGTAAREAALQTEQDRKAADARERWTQARWARDYHERVIEPSRTAKHGAQWMWAHLQGKDPVAALKQAKDRAKKRLGDRYVGRLWGALP